MKTITSILSITSVSTLLMLSQISLFAQNVGVGELNPNYKLHITSANSSILNVGNSTQLANNVNSDLFFKAGTFYTGAIKTIGTNINTARIGFFTYASTLSSSLMERLCITDGGNVGIEGNTTPHVPLAFANSSGSKISLSGTTETANNGMGIQGLTMQFYSSGSSADLVFGYGGSNSFTENMRIKGNGIVGIGNTTPADAGLIVDKKIGAVNAMFGRNTTGVAIESNYPGIGLNSYYNGGRKTMSTGYTGLIAFDPVNGNLGLYNSNASTATDAPATVSSRLFIDKDGDIGIEGNISPHAPLCCANIIGSKISLYGSVETSNYGFGIQSNLMQIYSASSSADIAFGYGGSTSFTERMRIKGDGNVGIGTATPSTKLQIAGGTDAGLASNGFIQFGPTNSINLVIDNNEIVARNNGLESDMWIQQDDGNLMLCGLGLGTVGVGVPSSADLATGYSLSVKGKIIAEELRVQAFASWPDYVFGDQYVLMPIDELQKSIRLYKHLPNIPSASEVEEDGILVGDMQKRMMEKIEELTLYIIDLHEINKQQQAEIEMLKMNVDMLKNK